MRVIIWGAMVAFTVAGLCAEDFKTGEAVLDHFVDVTGGAATYAKVHNTVMKGTISMPGAGIKGAVTIYAAEPNKVAMTSDIAGVGKMIEGSDGVNAWSFSAMQGPQVKKGDELASSLREAVFHKETEWRKYFGSAELSGSEDVDGSPAYKVILTPKSGPPETHYYDKTTGLQVRHQTIVSTAFGEIPVDVSIRNYGDACGIKLPHFMSQSVAGQKIEIQIDSIACNTDLPADTFQPPPEVKAIMNQQ